MRNRLVTALFLQLFAAAAAAQSYGFAFPANARLILPVGVAAELLQQCSRPSPAGATGYWVPEEARVQRLEEQLVVYLEGLSKSGVEVPPRGIAFHRQYVGFVRGQALYIYGNFYPGRNQPSSQERRLPSMICDGGASHWGIVYNVANERFEELYFNGVT